MWHMEHTAAEEWAGNAQRSREIFTAQLERLLDGERVPNCLPLALPAENGAGIIRIFFRGVEHYLKMTGDIEFARMAEPYMRKILSQTFREYDPLKTGVMGFGTQLGNQEDFLATHGPGSGSGCEGAHMLKIMAMLERLLDNKNEAEKYELYSKAVEEKGARGFFGLRTQAGSPGIGTPWASRLEAPYHSVCYPILYDMLPDREKVSSIDHLMHRLSGPSGEMYISTFLAGTAITP